MDQIQRHLKALRESLANVKDSVASSQATAKSMEALMEESMDELLDVDIMDDPGLWIELDKKVMACTVAFMDAMHDVDKRKGMMEVIEIRIDRIQGVYSRTPTEN